MLGRLPFSPLRWRGTVAPRQREESGVSFQGPLLYQNLYNLFHDVQDVRSRIIVTIKARWEKWIVCGFVRLPYTTARFLKSIMLCSRFEKSFSRVRVAKLHLFSQAGVKNIFTLDYPAFGKLPFSPLRWRGTKAPTQRTSQEFVRRQGHIRRSCRRCHAPCPWPCGRCRE